MLLRKLLVVTGTVNVEKGDGDERKRGLTISTNVMRSLRNLRVLKTPFGTLVNPSQAAPLRELVAKASDAVNAFNATSTVCRLTNSMLIEPLDGVRLSAVQGWLARRLREGARDVLQARKDLETLPSAAAA